MTVETLSFSFENNLALNRIAWNGRALGRGCHVTQVSHNHSCVDFRKFVRKSRHRSSGDALADNLYEVVIGYRLSELAMPQIHSGYGVPIWAVAERAIIYEKQPAILRGGGGIAALG